MKISELEVNQKKVNVEAEVVEKSPVKEFTRFGNPGRVATAIIEDDSGQTQLTLWDDQIDQVNVGDKISIENGYVKEWQGEKQLNIGRYGTMKIIN